MYSTHLECLTTYQPEISSALFTGEDDLLVGQIIGCKGGSGIDVVRRKVRHPRTIALSRSRL